MIAAAMPANLSPEYKTAEAGFRAARQPEDRLHWLREMLRTVPKHKGTEHLQADIKTRIKELTDELAGPRKGGARTGPPTSVRPEGAAQVALVGPPNAGKSALHARLTGSHAAVGPYPLTTQFPLPGMVPHGDVAFQLVDLPPVCRQHPVPWIANALRPADACLLVADLGDPGCVDALVEVHEVLAERRVTLTEVWPGDAGADERRDGSGDDEGDPFALLLPAALVAAKSDLLADSEAEVAVLRDLTGYPYPALALSAETGAGLGALGPFLFERLAVVRVYTKLPGQPPDTARPFTLRRGGTVGDLAAQIHKELVEGLRYARLWRGDLAGLHVGRDHPVEDGDVLELHAT